METGELSHPVAHHGGVSTFPLCTLHAPFISFSLSLSLFKSFSSTHFAVSRVAVLALLRRDGEGRC